LPLIEHGVTLLAAVEHVLPLVAGRLDELDRADDRRAERACKLRLLPQLHTQARRALGTHDTSTGWSRPAG